MLGLNSSLKIGDSNVALGNLISYSTTEKIIGFWIDGKPIYRKTFKGALDVLSLELTKTKINYDTIISPVTGWVYSMYGQWWPIPSVYNQEIGYEISVYYSESGIGIGTGSFYNKNASAYLTIEYTKTTD